MEQSDIDALLRQATTVLKEGHSASDILDELLTHIPEDKHDDVKKRFNEEAVAYAVDTLIAQAVTALEQGHGSSVILEELLKHVPPHLHEEVKKRFNREAVAFSMRAKSKEEKKDKPAMSVGEMLASLTQGAINNFKNLFQAKPDVGKSVSEAGKIFLKHGVTVHNMSISNDELGTMAPNIGLGKGKEQNLGR